MIPPIVLTTQVPLGAPLQPGGVPPVPGIPLGIGLGNTLQLALVSLQSGTATLDLTTLSGAMLEVIDPLGNVQTWTPSIMTATAGSATLSYAFQGTELLGVPCGLWRARVIGTAAGQLVPFGPPSAFPVVPY